MESELVFDELMALLDDERRAIRAMDARRVEEISERKVVLVQMALLPEAAGMPGVLPKLRRLAAELRRNSVLLAHARACLQDALPASYAVPAEGNARTLPSLVPRAGVLLSVKG